MLCFSLPRLRTFDCLLSSLVLFAVVVSNLHADAGEVITRHEYIHPDSGEKAAYLLYEPAEPISVEARSLLIYLHGAGGSLKNYNLKRESYVRLRTMLAKRGFYVVVPELGRYHFMNDEAKQTLDGIVIDVLEQWQIPAHRVHVMGTSMGGGSALAYAIHRTDMIRSVCAIMPMTDFAAWVREKPKYAPRLEASYGGTPQTRPEAYDINSAVKHLDAFKDIPVMLIHGRSDRIVNSSHSEKLANLMQEAGYACALRLVDRIGHTDAIVEKYQDEIMGFFAAAVEPSNE